MIESIPFGSTGHTSTRVIFGAAALGAMTQSRADATLETTSPMIIAAQIGPTPQIVVNDVADAVTAVSMRCLDAARSWL